MVAAELVGADEALDEGHVGRCRRVNFDGRRSRGGEDLGGRYGEREDVCGVGWEGALADRFDGGVAISTCHRRPCEW